MASVPVLVDTSLFEINKYCGQTEHQYPGSSEWHIIRVLIGGDGGSCCCAATSSAFHCSTRTMLVKSALRAPIVWMHAHKRRCIPACDQENGNRDSAANDANEFVQSLLNDMGCTTSWRSLQLLIQDLIDKVQKIDAERCILLLPRPGGSKKGRKIVKRDFAAAYETVMRHYFSEHPLYCHDLFRKRFRVSRAIFNRIYNACCTCHPYFQHRENAAGLWGIHPLVKITAVFRHFAYGIPADSLDEYLQMSETSVLNAREAFCEVRFPLFANKHSFIFFLQAVIFAFGEMYLPEVNQQLIAKLCRQHEDLGWPGLMGSLDCSHWEWDKCPKSLQGDFKKGSLNKPSVSYEAACDSDLFIWHCFFALPGSCNDLNVLDTSPLLVSIASGSTVFEFSVANNLYFQPYVLKINYGMHAQVIFARYLLVDGIYPDWTCFLGPISHPRTLIEQHYTKVQEGRRKDIERAFGALKLKWNILNRPSLTPKLTIMNQVLRVCVILHNMVVEEKRLTSENNTADEVCKDAEEADQVSALPSELREIQRSQGSCCSQYMKHLTNITAHNSLMQSIQSHLWTKKKLDMQSTRMNLLGRLSS